MFLKQCLSVSEEIAVLLFSVLCSMKGPMHLDTLYNIIITSKATEYSATVDKV